MSLNQRERFFDQLVQLFDRRVWLGGREPGELVDHELNPRLWPI